jgi:uncharacterized Zn finger protein
MYYGGFAPYRSVAQKKQDADKTIAKKIKNGEKISPIRIEGRKIASTFWGKAWCDHLESFSDYENRLPRGRSYVRHGAVIHLQIGKGTVEAIVQGSSLYKVAITIRPVAGDKWRHISKKCSGEIGSVIELLQGKLSSSVMKTITDQQTGLFPSPKQISLDCSCPDWADMCKHVAAVLYGVGARLDTAPDLLFTLRNVDHMELISQATLQPGTTRQTSSKTVTDQDLSALFGIDIEDSAKQPTRIKAGKIKTKAKKRIASKPPAKTTKKTKTKTKKPAKKESVTKTKPVPKKPARKRGK